MTKQEQRDLEESMTPEEWREPYSKRERLMEAYIHDAQLALGHWRVVGQPLDHAIVMLRRWAGEDAEFIK